MEKIVVIDFGGQYAHLIASKIRSLKVYSEIRSPDLKFSDLKDARGIVLSGSPHRISRDSPGIDQKIYELGIPVLGICYGHQLIARDLGGEIGPALQKEFGKAILKVEGFQDILTGLRAEEIVWMSHNDEVKKMPEGFTITASTPNCQVAVMSDSNRKIFGVQFHPEVTHTACGRKILENFIEISGCKKTWTMANFIQKSLREVKKKAKNRKVLILISGGVDSTVAAFLLTRALGPEKVFGLHVDNGLERKNEINEVKKSYSKLGFKNLRVRKASNVFLPQLSRVADPEKKRQIIGQLFVQILNEEVAKLSSGDEEWLVAQGTIYPDTIETAGTQHADLIKTHHNRVPAIQELIDKGALIEPIEQLYKDEVREVGKKLGLPEWLIWRHPFPGPGLAVRIICSDNIWRGGQFPQETILAEKEIQKLANEFNYEAWLLPVKTVGVQGDQRTYNQPIILKGPANWQILENISTEITNRFRETVNRVWYLVSPPYVSLRHMALWEKYLTPERIKLLQEADFITRKCLREAGLEREIWQMPIVLLPLSFTAYSESILLRPVLSENAMTAEFAKLPWKTVRKITKTLLGLEGVGSVFYDLTHKPPGTIELE